MNQNKVAYVQESFARLFEWSVTEMMNNIKHSQGRCTQRYILVASVQAMVLGKSFRILID